MWKGQMGVAIFNRKFKLYILYTYMCKPDLYSADGASDQWRSKRGAMGAVHAALLGGGGKIEVILKNFRGGYKRAVERSKIERLQKKGSQKNFGAWHKNPEGRQTS